MNYYFTTRYLLLYKIRFYFIYYNLRLRRRIKILKIHNYFSDESNHIPQRIRSDRNNRWIDSGQDGYTAFVFAQGGGNRKSAVLSCILNKPNRHYSRWKWTQHPSSSSRHPFQGPAASPSLPIGAATSAERNQLLFGVAKINQSTAPAPAPEHRDYPDPHRGNFCGLLILVAG